MKQTKRILAWVLMLTLLMGMLPGMAGTAWAVETEEAVEPLGETTPAAEIAPETTEPAAAEVPETTETAVPETTEAAAPEATEATVPETTEATIPETTEATVPETTEATIPETTEAAVPETTEVAARDEMLTAETSGEPEVEEMYLGQSKTLTLADGESAQFSFTAEVSGEYVIHMPIIGDYDNFYLFTYDEQLYGWIGEEVNNGVYFGRSFYLEAGEKCYFELVNSRVHKELTGTVRIDPMVNASEISIVDVKEERFHFPYPDGIVTFTTKPVPETAYFGNATWSSSDSSVLEYSMDYAECGVLVIFHVNKTGTATITVTTDSGLTASLDYEICNYKILDLEIPLDGEITARVDCSIQKFKGVKVNGEELDAKYYTVTEGSTIVTLHEDYLNALPEGDYEVTLQFTDGQSQFQFSIIPDDLGDLNGDEKVNTDDALYLALNLFYPDDFPLKADGDLNSDGKINTDDAVYLVLYLFYPQDFPLYP